MTICVSYFFPIPPLTNERPVKSNMSYVCAQHLAASTMQIQPSAVEEVIGAFTSLKVVISQFRYFTTR